MKDKGSPPPPQPDVALCQAHSMVRGRQAGFQLPLHSLCSAQPVHLYSAVVFVTLPNCVSGVGMDESIRLRSE